ncbi:hypothetical protein [Echinicola rosea]|nr:hypothetical protein [Echinicola rosea]
MHRKLKFTLLVSIILTLAIAFQSCERKQAGKTGQLQAKDTIATKKDDQTVVFDSRHFGNYVDDGYAQRDKGSDWVAVTVRPLDDSFMRVSIRSRSDRKRPTCTFDTNASVVDQHTLKAFEQGSTLLFTFSDSTISVTTEKESEEGSLYFFCSGGATIAGNYQKLEGNLDATQVDPTDYTKTLNLSSQLFIVTAREEALIIESPTLEVDKGPYESVLTGEVLNAEIGDLNADGEAEIFIYSRDGEGYGKVVGYSVNNGKSMSMIAIPPIADSQEANAGYEGGDEFAIVENNLVRRFPLANGKTKQIQYKLKDGEAMRQLVVDKVMVY